MIVLYHCKCWKNLPFYLLCILFIKISFLSTRATMLRTAIELQEILGPIHLLSSRYGFVGHLLITNLQPAIRLVLSVSSNEH